MKPQYYYHVSTRKDWGNKIRLFPRTPESIATGEPQTKRICVCPTIEGCISAVWSCYASPYINVYIYRTWRKVLADKPYCVTDAKITGERWLLNPIVFKLVGKIEGKKLYDNVTINYVAGGDHSDLKKQQKAMEQIKAVLSGMDLTL